MAFVRETVKLIEEGVPKKGTITNYEIRNEGTPDERIYVEVEVKGYTVKKAIYNTGSSEDACINLNILMDALKASSLEELVGKEVKVTRNTVEGGNATGFTNLDAIREVKKNNTTTDTVKKVTKATK